VNIRFSSNHSKFFSTVSVMFIGIILLFSLVPLQSIYAANISLGNNIITIGDSDEPTFVPLQQIANFGENVYVAWSSSTQILFSSSANGGNTFGPPSPVTGLTGSHTPPHVAASGDNVYLTWVDAGQVMFSSSVDNGNIFSAATPIANVPLKKQPQVAAAGDNVYLIWQNTNEISFSKSTDNGDMFSAPSSIPDVNPGFGDPSIATSGNNVYVGWSSGTQVLLSSSTDSGDNFQSANAIDGESTAPTSVRLATSGNQVYAVWQEIKDVKFVSSLDNGLTFGSEKDLSQTPTDTSRIPQVSTDENNVFVTWEQNAGGTADVSLVASDDQGTSFTAVSMVNEAGNPFLQPQIASSGDTAFVTWRDLTDFVFIPDNILFRTASLACPCISFADSESGQVKSEFKRDETAVITVEDSTNTGVGNLVLDSLTSSSDPAGIIGFTLTETPANSGIFTGSVTFGDATSASTLLVSAGDTITASFGGNNGIASIFPIIIEFFGENPDKPITKPFDIQEFLHVRVTDQNANTNPLSIETISIKVNSTGDPVGISLILPETGENTGIFGGVSNTDLLLMKNDTRISRTGSIIVEQEIDLSGLNPNVIDEFTVSAFSTSDPEGIPLTLRETDVHTGVFREELILSYVKSGFKPNVLHAEAGDFVTTDNGSTKSHSFVVPNPNPQNGAILVDLSGGSNASDKVRVTYNLSEEQIVGEFFGGGGGGGGLVRPGLVVNIIAGAGLFGGGSGGGANPTFGDGTVLVLENQSDGFGGTISDGDDISLDSTKVVKVGDEVVLRFELYENQGINNLERFKMYTPQQLILTLHIRGEERLQLLIHMKNLKALILKY